MTEDLLKDFFTTLLERIRVYDYKLEIDSDISSDYCEFSLYYHSKIIYNFWASVTDFRIVVSDQFFVVEPTDTKYSDTMDLASIIIDTLFPVLVKLDMVHNVVDLSQVILGFRYSNWTTFITHYLKELGIKYYNYDGMIRTDNAVLFVDSDKQLLFQSVQGQEFYKEFKNDLTLQEHLFDFIRLVNYSVDELNILTCEYVSPIIDVLEEEDISEQSYDDSDFEEFDALEETS